MRRGVAKGGVRERGIKMKSSQNSVIALVALGLAVAGLGVHSASAEELHLRGEFSWSAYGTSYEIEDGHTYWVGAFTGTYLDENAVEPFHGTGIMCPGYNDIGFDAAGYCVLVDEDGDEAYSEWSCDFVEPPAGAILAADCNNNWTSGTGKFDGISGEAPFASYVVSVNPDGSTSGYAVWDYTVSLPN